MIQVEIKKAVKAGNSSAVILPRAWLNREVRIELVKKTPEIILSDVIDIIKKDINTKSIIGVYLVGSYARGEEDENSDIDVLVVTSNINKEMIHEGIYNILAISSELLKEKLKRDLFPIGQMLKEAKTLLNSSYLELIEVKVTRSNIKWYIDTTKEKLKIIKKIIDKMKKKRYINDRVAYTLVLRIKTLYIIRKLVENKDYSKKEFVRLIKKISGSMRAYERYLAIKNDLEEKEKMSIEEAERLYEYLKDELIRVRKLVKIKTTS